MQADLLTSVETVSTYDTGNLLGSMEMRIPWDVLYFDDLHSIQEYPRIKMVAVITSGDDQSSGPDCAPDNLGGMANSSGQMVILDNYVEILIDANNDGIWDPGESATLNVELANTGSAAFSMYPGANLLFLEKHRNKSRRLTIV